MNTWLFKNISDLTIYTKISMICWLNISLIFWYQWFVGVNTGFVGNVIECAYLVPSLKGIGKTFKQLRVEKRLCKEII